MYKLNLVYKIISIIVISTISLIAFVGCSGSKTNIDGIDESNTEMRIYEVFGMDCPGCHGGLENLINEITGVITSEANWEKQQLKVFVSTNIIVSDEAIFDAVKKANFTPGKRIK
jgi:copper chaperone CopZ